MRNEKSAWRTPFDEPVIRPGQLHPPYDAHRAGAAHVMRIGGEYFMYYWGSDKSSDHTILCATSSIDEPNVWRARGTVLIAPQPQTQHNTRGPSFPFVMPLDERRWLLYFCGWGSGRADGKIANTTGVAISDDAGETWRYFDGNPILPLGRPCDREGSGSVWVMRIGERLRIYYTALGSYGPKPAGVATGHGEIIPSIGIACAESDDGLHWIEAGDGLVVRPRGFAVEPFEYICSKPCVVKDATGFTMWVNTFGTAYRVHRLHSRDGLNWDWGKRVGPDGEFGTGHPGAFDDHQRSYPSILVHGKGYRCWYTGNQFGATGIGYAEQTSVGLPATNKTR